MIRHCKECGELIQFGAYCFGCKPSGTSYFIDVRSSGQKLDDLERRILELEKRCKDLEDRNTNLDRALKGGR